MGTGYFRVIASFIQTDRQTYITVEKIFTNKSILYEKSNIRQHGKPVV